MYYMYAQCVCVCVLCDVLAEEAKESGLFIQSSLTTSAGRVLQRLMELQCTRREFLPAESAAPQTVIDHRCSSNARRCLLPPKLPSIAPPGPGLADEWDAIMADMARHPTVPTVPTPGLVTSLKKGFSWL